MKIMDYKYLKTSRKKNTLWVEIHNPPVNFLTVALLEELFHERIVAYGHHLHPGIVRLLGGVEQAADELDGGHGTSGEGSGCADPRPSGRLFAVMPCSPPLAPACAAGGTGGVAAGYPGLGLLKERIRRDAFPGLQGAFPQPVDELRQFAPAGRVAVFGHA